MSEVPWEAILDPGHKAAADHCQALPVQGKGTVPLLHAQEGMLNCPPHMYHPVPTQNVDTYSNQGQRQASSEASYLLY